MSGYYVLALENGKVCRHDAAGLPDAQKLMRKHGPSAAIFTGMKCFGSIPGIDRRSLDTLILAARSGGLGACVFCDEDAVAMVDGDPVCATHQMSGAEDEDLEDDGEEEPQPEPVRVTPQPEPVPSVPAASHCLWTNCSAAPSDAPTHDPTLAPYCPKHRGLAKANGIRPGQPVPPCSRCGVNPRGAQSERTPSDQLGLCQKCRKRLIDASRGRRHAAPAPKAAAPKAVAQAPKTPSAAPGLREAFERLLADHELVEVIGREVCVALASRVKGGAR